MQILIYLQSLTGINHYSVFIGVSFIFAGFNGFWMRAMRKPRGMKTHHSRLQIVSAEKIPLVIKDQLVIVCVFGDKMGLLKRLCPALEAGEENCRQ